MEACGDAWLPSLGCSAPRLCCPIAGSAGGCCKLDICDSTTWRSGIAYLHKSKGEGGFFVFPPENSLSYQALGITYKTAKGAEQSQTLSHCFELILNFRDQTAATGYKRGSSKDQPIPSPGPKSSVKLCPPLQLRV